MSYQTTYTANVNQDKPGMLWAEVHELPGCFASGGSLDELREALTESIALYLGNEHGRDARVAELRLRVPA